MLTKTGNSNAESTDVTVEIDPVLSLKLSKDEINLNPNPEPSGTFAYDTLSAIVDTNNRTGYTLTMNSETEEAALIQEGSDITIPTITSDINITSENQANFTMNHWGYSLTSALSDSGTTFNKIPALSIPDTIAESEGPIAGDTTPVSFATRVDTSLPSGTYENTVVFTAVANHIPMAFEGITYMQDMTAEICAKEITPTKEATKTTHYRTDNTNLVPEAILTDSRDGEQYIVRKLADGNCWMNQNLRLKLTANQALTSADTDVASNFTPTISTQATSENTTSWGTYDNASDVNASRSYDTGNRDYGTYYNWYTATAGTGLYDNIYKTATSSICPKGWQLPLVSGTKSYRNLITTTYGLSGKAGSTALQSAPLSFPLSGYYNYSGSVVAQGLSGNFLSASSGPSAVNAYALTFMASLIVLPANASKATGYSVRCVARGEQYTINFDSSEADSGIASASTDLGGNIDLAYYSSLFKKDGYTLKQWRDQDGNTYDATSTSVDVNPTSAATITLTAVWKRNTTFFPETLTTMQGMTADICNSVTTPSKDAVTSVTSASTYTDPNTQVPQVTLTDTRDNNTYTVRKLADGNCWMTQNLRIVGSKALTSADSDVSSNWTLPAASTSGFSSNTAANVGPVNSSYGNGAYYTWCAATAGTCSSATAQNREAPSSICPKGWRLPYSGTSQTGSKSFKYLMDIYGYSNGSQLTAQPLQFAYGGGYGNSSFDGGGSVGFYWSSTANSSSLAYNLILYSSGVSPQSYDGRSNGQSVRRVAR